MPERDEFIQNKSWPAAKYLSYSLWRAWILATYTAPVWGLTQNDLSTFQAVSCMYLYSTISYVICAAGLAIGHKKVTRLLLNNRYILFMGLLASIGTLLEFLDWNLHAQTGSLFIIGALITGIGTSAVSVRAGMIYAAARPTTAITNTALSEMLAVLMYFFVLGAPRVFSILLTCALPVTAAFVTMSDKAKSVNKSFLSFAPKHKQDLSALIRFLIIVILLTAIAVALKCLTQANIQTEELFYNGSAWGLSLVLFISFFIVIFTSSRNTVSFFSLYYPIVFMLAISVAVSTIYPNTSMIPILVSTSAYSLFSLFMWGLLTFLSRGESFTPVQVFGFGRCAFALGSLTGWTLGMGNTLIVFRNSPYFLNFGLIIAFLIVAGAMFIFRDSDVHDIMRRVAPIDSYIDTAMHSTGISYKTGSSSSEETVETYENFARRRNLSEREREVFKLMVRGRNAKAIAEILTISENTAKSHIRNVYAKIGVHTRQEFIDATGHLR